MGNRRAFTLVELLIASTMLVLLGGAGYAVFAAGTHAAAKTRRRSRMVVHAQRALSAMSADIRAAVEHKGTRLTSLDAEYEGLDADTIDFIAVRTRRGQPEPGAGGRAEIGYYIDNDPGTEARWLLRREDATLDDDPLEGGVATPAGPCVSELNIEYFDEFGWVDGWHDSDAFPRGVRIAIVVLDADEVEAPMLFETTVCIAAP